jgi:hypothetical protein
MLCRQPRWLKRCAQAAGLCSKEKEESVSPLSRLEEVVFKIVHEIKQSVLRPRESAGLSS